MLMPGWEVPLEEVIVMTRRVGNWGRAKGLKVKLGPRAGLGAEPRPWESELKAEGGSGARSLRPHSLHAGTSCQGRAASLEPQTSPCCRL